MKRKTSLSAGHDLTAATDGQIMAGHFGTIELDQFGSAIPWWNYPLLEVGEVYYGQLEVRSGLSAKFGLIRLAGVIDMDYQGQLKLLVFNSGTVDFGWADNDRVCQLIILKAYYKDTVDTKRTGGFGSTGIGG